MVPGRRRHRVVGRLRHRRPRRPSRVAWRSPVRRRCRRGSPPTDTAHRRLLVTRNGSPPRRSGRAVRCSPGSGGGGGCPHVKLLVLRFIRCSVGEILARKRTVLLSRVRRRLGRPRRGRHSRGRSGVRRGRRRRRRWRSCASGRRRRGRGGEGIWAHAGRGVRSLRRPRSRRPQSRGGRREVRGGGRGRGRGTAMVRRRALLRRVRRGVASRRAEAHLATDAPVVADHSSGDMDSS